MLNRVVIFFLLFSPSLSSILLEKCPFSKSDRKSMPFEDSPPIIVDHVSSDSFVMVDGSSIAIFNIDYGSAKDVVDLSFSSPIPTTNSIGIIPLKPRRNKKKFKLSPSSSPSPSPPPPPPPLSLSLSVFFSIPEGISNIFGFGESQPKSERPFQSKSLCAFKRIPNYPLQDCFHKVLMSETNNSKVYSGYLSEDKNASEMVILKFGYPDQNSHNCIVQEFKILKILKDSSHIPKVFSVYQNFDLNEYNTFFSMQIIPSDPMAHLTMSIEDINHYGKQLLDVLKHCHSHFIIHADLKPGNILIDPINRHLTLIDWGNSKQKKIDSKYIVDVCCTEWYRAPEMELRHNWSFGVDVWSFGIVIANWLFKNTSFTSERSIISNDIGFPTNILKALGFPGFLELAALQEDTKLALRFSRFLIFIDHEGWDEIKRVYGLSRSGEDLDAGISIISFILQYLPSKRPSIDEILEHSYFK